MGLVVLRQGDQFQGLVFQPLRATGRSDYPDLFCSHKLLCLLLSGYAPPWSCSLRCANITFSSQRLSEEQLHWPEWTKRGSESGCNPPTTTPVLGNSERYLGLTFAHYNTLKIQTACRKVLSVVQTYETLVQGTRERSRQPTGRTSYAPIAGQLSSSYVFRNGLMLNCFPALIVRFLCIRAVKCTRCIFQSFGDQGAPYEVDMHYATVLRRQTQCIMFCCFRAPRLE